jgi:3D (Asp-Asp-Asp) domain-containing protein
MVLELVLLGATMSFTSYRSVPEQTDSTPFHTSIGEHVAPGGCAVSRDLLKSGYVKYGDYLYIDGHGLCRVNDVMNKRHRNSVDVWVATYPEEKKIGYSKRTVWKVGKPVLEDEEQTLALK